MVTENAGSTTSGSGEVGRIGFVRVRVCRAKAKPFEERDEATDIAIGLNISDIDFGRSAIGIHIGKRGVEHRGGPALVSVLAMRVHEHDAVRCVAFAQRDRHKGNPVVVDRAGTWAFRDDLARLGHRPVRPFFLGDGGPATGTGWRVNAGGIVRKGGHGDGHGTLIRPQKERGP